MEGVESRSIGARLQDKHHRPLAGVTALSAAARPGRKIRLCRALCPRRQYQGQSARRLVWIPRLEGGVEYVRPKSVCRAWTNTPTRNLPFPPSGHRGHGPVETISTGCQRRTAAVTSIMRRETYRCNRCRDAGRLGRILCLRRRAPTLLEKALQSAGAQSSNYCQRLLQNGNDAVDMLDADANGLSHPRHRLLLNLPATIASAWSTPDGSRGRADRRARSYQTLYHRMRWRLRRICRCRVPPRAQSQHDVEE